MRIGLFGGTFNPIHWGHLLTAQEVMERQNLDEIWLIPNGRPPHRLVVDATPEDRYLMTHLACLEHPRFKVSRIELEASTRSYSYQTVSRLKQEFPAHTFFFITGADAVQNYVWRNFDELLGDAGGFLVSSRPGFDWARLDEKLALEQLSHRAKIHYLELPLLEISSTRIRNQVQTGRSIHFYVPRAVQDYIAKRGLYREEEASPPVTKSCREN